MTDGWDGDAERAFGQEGHLVDQNLDDGAKASAWPGKWPVTRRQRQQRTKRRR
jgi:hypothetical protein